MHLLPQEFYRLTPGEYSDMMHAVVWAQKRSQPSAPLLGPARAAEIAKFDRLRGQRG